NMGLARTNRKNRPCIKVPQQPSQFPSPFPESRFYNHE
ncbi:MAG: hypothetical protein ACI9UJ_002122, partial [bacterium]